jgi:MFS family permease
MQVHVSEIRALQALSQDGRLLFATRMTRLFAYGFLSVVLALYLAQLGFNNLQIGWLLTWTLAGDAVISLAIAGVADRIGRRRMLLLGAGLMVGAGLVFALTGNLFWLTVAAIIGTLSPSGAEVGPFLSIEQAILPPTAPDDHRTQIFAWYNLTGSFSTALGALASGGLAQTLQNWGHSPLESYRVVVVGYALLGVILGVLFSHLSPAAEVQTREQLSPLPPRSSAPLLRFGLHRSHAIVLRLAALFMLDAFAGGLVVQSLIAYWLHLRYGVEPAGLGGIFFWGEYPGRAVGAGGGASGPPDWAGQHHGLDSYPLQCPLNAGAADAQLAACRGCPAGSLQHLTNGCTHPPIVHYGRR